jgi:hypothetical protein
VVAACARVAAEELGWDAAEHERQIGVVDARFMVDLGAEALRSVRFETFAPRDRSNDRDRQQDA